MAAFDRFGNGGKIDAAIEGNRTARNAAYSNSETSLREINILRRQLMQAGGDKEQSARIIARLIPHLNEYRYWAREVDRLNQAFHHVFFQLELSRPGYAESQDLPTTPIMPKLIEDGGTV